MLNDMYHYGARDVAGNFIPFTVFPSDVMTKDGKETMISEVMVMAISDLGKKILPKNPFFIPVLSGQRKLFVDFLERFVTNIPRGVTMERYNESLRHQDDEFRKQWGFGEYHEGDKGLFYFVTPIRDFETKCDEHLLSVSAFCYDLRTQFNTKLLRPVVELEWISKTEPDVFRFYVENVWELYVNMKFVKKPEHGEGNFLQRDGTPRAVNDYFS